MINDDDNNYNIIISIIKLKHDKIMAHWAETNRCTKTKKRNNNIMRGAAANEGGGA